MSLVHWEEILPDNVSVSFSSLSIPEQRDEIDRDVAEIQLTAGYVIDIEWDDNSREYFVTLFKDYYENTVVQEVIKTPEEVVRYARQLAERYSHVPGAEGYSHIPGIGSASNPETVLLEI